MSFEIASPETVGICSSRLSRINRVMEEATHTGSPVGISTMIARRGSIVHFEQFGLKDREAKEPMSKDTLFRLYSMTKPIVCTAFMTLYEQGKFDLNDPVSKYISAFADLKVLQRDEKGRETLVDTIQPVTIHHLLTHTSGLAYDFYEEYTVCDLYRQHQILANVGTSLEKFVHDLCQIPLAFQPGTQWYYSVGIDVIGRLIEIIADKQLAEFLSEMIFLPLGMNDIGFFIPEEKRNRVAAMYGGVDLCAPNISWSHLMEAWESGANNRLDVSKTCPVDDINFMRGGSGLTGSAMDYITFAQMLLNKGEFNDVQILSPKTIEFMHANHVDPALLPIGFADWKLTGYGFGLGSRVLLNAPESKLIGTEGEYGWVGAAKTYYWVDPKEELIGLFLTQSMCDFSMIERTFQTLTYQAIMA